MGAILQFATVVEYRADCFKCGAPIFMSDSLYKQRYRDRESFFCVNGHGQHWTGESAEDKLKRQLELEKNRRESAERETATARKAEAIARGKMKAQKERVGNGVCPCCNRTFQNLMRHMSTKHPHFKDEAAT